MSNRMVSRSVTAAAQFTDAIVSGDGGATVAVSGTFTGTITLQIRPQYDVEAVAGVNVEWTTDAGWVDLATWTAATDPSADTTVNTQRVWGAWAFRIGAKTGEWTTGTAKVWLGVRNAFSM